MHIHDYSPDGSMPSADEPQWTTETLQQDFEVKSFVAPYVIVIRKSDGQKGTLQFNHSPRVYWGFEAI